MELRGATILVVDDEPIVNLTMSLLLRGAGAVVLRAEHGEQAFQLATTQPVDIMICDQNMPVMDGNALLHKLRGAKKSVPTLFFASGVQHTDAAALQELGVRFVLSKPIQPATLIERVTAVLAEVPQR